MFMTLETVIKNIPEALGEKTKTDSFSQYRNWAASTTANTSVPKETIATNTANQHLPLLALVDTTTQLGKGAAPSKTIDSGHTSPTKPVESGTITAANPSENHPTAVNPTETGEIPIKGPYGPSTDTGTETGQLKPARTIIQPVENGPTKESGSIKPALVEPIEPVVTAPEAVPPAATKPAATSPKGFRKT
jgi:hypothetical protein